MSLPDGSENRRSDRSGAVGSGRNADFIVFERYLIFFHYIKRFDIPAVMYFLVAQQKGAEVAALTDPTAPERSGSIFSGNNYKKSRFSRVLPCVSNIATVNASTVGPKSTEHHSHTISGYFSASPSIFHRARLSPLVEQCPLLLPEFLLQAPGPRGRSRKTLS